MKAEIVLLISKEHPLMSQLCSIFGKDAYMRDFTTISIVLHKAYRHWQDNNVHKQRQIICLRPMTEWPPLHAGVAATILQ